MLIEDWELLLEAGIVWFGLIGSIASVLGYFITIRATASPAIHALYTGVIVLVVTTAVFYRTEYVRTQDVARQADQLINDRKMKYTNRGFAHAALAFLEKNRDLYPDVYARAVTMCAKFKCEEPDSDVEMVDYSSALRGLVQGLGTLSR